MFTKTQIWKKIHLCSVLYNWFFHDLSLNTVEPCVGFQWLLFKKSWTILYLINKVICSLKVKIRLDLQFTSFTYRKWFTIHKYRSDLLADFSFSFYCCWLKLGNYGVIFTPKGWKWISILRFNGRFTSRHCWRIIP